MARKKSKSSPFPIAGDSYFSVPVTSPRSVSSGGAVRELQAALGLEEDGQYGPATREAVLAAQKKAGVPLTGVVSADDWDVLVNGAKPEATEPSAEE